MSTHSISWLLSSSPGLGARMQPVTKRKRATHVPAANEASEGTAPRTARTYMNSAERERQIVQAAIGYFAENGFGGSTRELAVRLGIAHGLVFKYFPTKEDLIERVYKELFAGHWDPQWEMTLQDASIPLLDRLVTVYSSYADRINRYEWVRIYLFAGLNGTKINARYWGFVRERLIRFVVDELRAVASRPPVSEVAISTEENELLWSLHSAIFYLGVRKWVYQVPIPDDREATIRQLVQGFLDSAARVIGIPRIS